MPASLSIRLATRSEEEQVAATITLAFSADPIVCWIFPNPLLRLRTFMKLVGLYGGQALDHGSAHVIGDYAAVALWLPPGIEPETEKMRQLFAETVSAETLSIYLAQSERVSAHHPREPHWYLPLIGVDAGHQGKGYGTALMKRGLAACDREHKPAYLESTNRANLSLYERFGFRLLEEVRIGDCPPKFAMLREPR
jgi:GNAT superfamily N-acetyltransferase